MNQILLDNSSETNFNQFVFVSASAFKNQQWSNIKINMAMILRLQKRRNPLRRKLQTKEKNGLQSLKTPRKLQTAKSLFREAVTIEEDLEGSSQDPKEFLLAEEDAKLLDV